MLKDYLLTLFDEEMVNSSTMSIWEKAFTHPSVNPNENYNSLKIFGDTELKYAFKMYLYRYHNSNKPHFLTTLSNYYMSKEYQPSMTINLGLDEWIRVDDIEINDNILVDILKAFIGAINVISSKLYTEDPIKNLYSIEVIYRFVTTYFKENPIDESKGRGVPKTELLEIWRYFTNETGNYNVDKNGKIILGDTFFRNLSKTPDGTKMVSEIKSVKLEDENEQINSIVEILYHYGITKEWRQEQIPWRNFTDVQEIVDICKSNNIDRFIIEDLWQGDEKFYQLLYYYNDKGKQKSKILKLFSSDKGVDVKSESIRIIRDYFR